MTNPKSSVAGGQADSARREREKIVSEDKSGTQEKRPNEHADDDIRNEAAERASNAAIANRPVG